MDPEKNKFEKASLQHMDAIYSLAIRLTKSSVKAEELVQITYFRAYKSFAKLGDPAHFKSWALSLLRQVYRERFSQDQPLAKTCVRTKVAV